MATMKPATVGGTPYQVPPEPSRWPAVAMAAAVHAVLLAFLYIGVSWQNTAPVEVEAEVWDMKVQSAAPPPPMPTPVPVPTPTPPEPTPPEPEPVPVEAPTPKPMPKEAPPPVVKPQPVAPKAPDIALEREKRKAELRKQQLIEKEIEDKRQKKLLALEKEKDKLREKDQREKELKAQKKADELAEKKLAAEKLKAEKLANAKLAAAEQKKLDKIRDEQTRRITAGAGVSGEAPKATAPKIDSGYLAAIVSKVKGATSYPGDTDVSGNPRVVFKVDQLPSGEIVSVKKIKGSGVAAFDDAVEKGIIKSSPLPKKKDGTVERTLEIAFSMKDLD
jgi:colicin import membrane protein